MKGDTKKRSYMWLCIFCAGMAAGTVLVNYMVRTSVMDTSVLTAYVRELTKKPFEDIYFFIYLCISRLAFFLVLSVLAAAFRTPVLFAGMTAIFGASFGCIVSLAAMVYGYGGILVAAALLFPQYIIYVPIYIFLLKMVDNNKFDDTIGHTSASRLNQRRAVLAAVFAVLVILGCAVESYVNPFVVRQVEKFF